MAAECRVGTGWSEPGLPLPAAVAPTPVGALSGLPDGVSGVTALDEFADPGFLRAQAAEHGTPVLLLDCRRVRANYRRLAAALPGVALHYAIKALPHPAVIATLAAENGRFDIATSGEIALLREQQVDPKRTLHTHPIKRERDIRDALAYGCRTFVVDNADELRKFVPFRDRARLLLRVAFRSPDARVDLAKKFGCAVAEVPFLLALAQQLGVRVSGLSFHVGSQCASPAAYVEAIEICAGLIETSRAASRSQPGRPRLNVLDIGGGFPVEYGPEGGDVAGTSGIESFCAPIRRALAALPAGVRVIAEPGRYLVADAMVSIASVIGRARRADRRWYYLDDGIYGSFSSMLSEGARYPLWALPAAGPAGAGRCWPSVLAGPTCDSVDVIAQDILLPELALGDLVVARMMGAYTAACASEFNSIPKTGVVAYHAPTVAWRRIA